ncbi:MAG TPA: hypothetical protein ENH04_00820 [Nitrospirae bacterium]|nr:hypothetical protein [Nitrospirota bacterium]
MHMIEEDHSDKKEPGKAKILDRVIAKVIDFIIIGVLIEAIPKAGYFAGLAYLLLGDGLFEGRSLGKRLIKLRVVFQEGGSVCGFRESVMRNFPFAAAYILMVIPIIGFVFPLLVLIFESLLMIGNERGMRFGDELAKTRVIGESAETLNSIS